VDLATLCDHWGVAFALPVPVLMQMSDHTPSAMNGAVLWT
jgi:hypothetical protein